MLELPTQLTKWGLDVTCEPGWETRAYHGRFNPVGVLIHHTGGKPPRDMPSLWTVLNGRPDLKPPLCQILIGRSGKVHIIAAGRANHAGTGGPIAPPSGKPTIPANDGNRYLVGIEAENDGLGEAWPPAQVDAVARATAAVLQLLGAPADCCWGHKEWTPRKPDPRGIEMAEFRALVLAYYNMPQPPLNESQAMDLNDFSRTMDNVRALYIAYRPTPFLDEDQPEHETMMERLAQVASETGAWARDIAARLAKGEDMNPVLQYIQFELAKAYKP
jgi:hypothetical protein